MTESENVFTGRWLHTGDWSGKEFRHILPTYDHDESPGGEGSTQMKHMVVQTDGTPASVWVPDHWTEHQAREALESNW